MVGTQIYCRRPSLGEVKALIEMGVTHIAWDLSPQDGDRIVVSSQIIEMIQQANRVSTLLVHSRKIAVLSSICRMIRPDYLLLSSDRNDHEMPSLASAVGPQTKLMMSVPVRVSGSNQSLPSIELARSYAAFAGALTVDTCLDPARPAVFGCTGRTNDWKICAEIVKAVDIPVVLAGGLNVENVAESILAVRPAIVDACTSLELADKSKDLSLCRRFVANANEASSLT